MIVVGGITEEGPDTRVLRLSLNGVPSWSEMVTTGGPPTARYGASLVYDPNGNRMILFGGFGSAYLNDVWALDLTTHGWSQLLPSGAPPSARGYHTAIYDPGHQRMVVFGGFNSSGDQNDTWALTLTGPPAWAPLVTAGTPPSARESHNAVFAAGEMFVFAGNASGTPMNDTWQLTLPSGGGIPTWSQVATLGSPPSPRYAHAAVYDGANRRMVVFGGGPGAFSYKSDVWVLPLATLQWSQLAPAVPGLSFLEGREYHSAVYDPQNQRMVAFGGTTPSTILGDTWSLSLGGTPQWSELTPPPRVYAAVAWDGVRNRMMVFGGQSPTALLGDLWTYEPTSPPHWSQILPAGPTPPARKGATLVHDLANDRFVLFAGTGAGAALLNDVWALLPGPPATWTQLSPAGPPPPPRWLPTAVMDGNAGRMVVFGGAGPAEAFGDTWTLSLNGPPVWSQQLAMGPPARYGHVAVFDPVYWNDPTVGHMVVATGIGGVSPSDDTWDWIASGTPFWTALAAGFAVPARFSASAAYDPVRDQMLLFGGNAGTGSFFNDLWMLPFYDTKVWSQQFPSGISPPQREGSGAVYDPVLDRMLMLGGSYGTGTSVHYLNDFWQLDRSRVAVGVGDPVAVELRVSPIRPNPSRGLVRLDLELPQASEVQVAVFDVAGRRAHLSTQSLPAGRHELNWDGHVDGGARAPDGVYFAHVKAGGGEQVRRFVLLR